jgi:hypothetical protein
MDIIRNEGNTIYYLCECKTKGRCMIRPFDKEAAVVVDIECPNCKKIERILLLQYDSEENKEEMMKDIEELDFTWSYVVENKIIS